MRIRFFLNLALAVGAVFLVVASQAFAPFDIANLALGVGIGMLVLSLALAALHRGRIVSVMLGATSTLVSAWLVISSQVLSLATVQNMTLACSLALAGLAAAGLTAHELSTERVVHALQPLSERDREADLLV